MSNTKPKPPCETVLPWLQANLGKHCVAPLTGTDARALKAAVQIIDLYSTTGSSKVLAAFGLVVREMQDTTKELAFHAIAHVMDWSDRYPLWIQAELDPLEHIRRCKHDGTQPVMEGAA